MARGTKNSLSNPTTTLSAGISAGAATAPVVLTTEFPTGVTFGVNIGNTATDQEVIDCTYNGTTTITFVGTTTKDHSSGDPVNIVWTENDYTNFVKKDDSTYVNGDIIQRKSGALTNRTLLQFQADLVALTAWVFSGATSIANGISFRAAGNTIYSSATNTLNLAAGGTLVATITSALFAVTGVITATSYIQSYAGTSDAAPGVRVGTASYGFWSQSNKLHVVSGGVKMATFQAGSVTEFLLYPVRFALGWYVTPKKLTAADFALVSGTTYSYAQSPGDSQDLIVTEVPPSATIVQVVIGGDKQGQNYEVIDAMLAYGGGPGAATVPIEVQEGFGLTTIATINTDGGSQRVKCMVTDSVVLPLI